MIKSANRIWQEWKVYKLIKKNPTRAVKACFIVLDAYPLLVKVSFFNMNKDLNILPGLTRVIISHQPSTFQPPVAAFEEKLAS
ncbi:hypothetical protein ACTJIJ_16005 [Niabella sp. 22666]|uniref:hypothetical protein n=1 Tax=Niabella sp. 22666 TaxID=3453954 RepID=UPI003F864C0D